MILCFHLNQIQYFGFYFRLIIQVMKKNEFKHIFFVQLKTTVAGKHILSLNILHTMQI